MAFHEELDLLESHYDAALFRSRHGALLALHGLADEAPPAALHEGSDPQT